MSRHLRPIGKIDQLTPPSCARTASFERKPILSAWSTFVPLTAAEQGVALSELGALPGVSGVALAIRAPLSLSGGGLAQPVVFRDRSVDPAAGPPAIKYNERCRCDRCPSRELAAYLTYV